MGKEDVVCIYIYIFFFPPVKCYSTKNMLPFETTWMDFEGIMLSKIGQNDKDKCHMISLM